MPNKTTTIGSAEIALHANLDQFNQEMQRFSKTTLVATNAVSSQLGAFAGAAVIHLSGVSNAFTKLAEAAKKLGKSTENIFNSTNIGKGIDLNKPGTAIIRYSKALDGASASAAVHTTALEKLNTALATTNQHASNSIQAFKLATGAVELYGTAVIATTSKTDILVNGYRALRIALSPTLFTAAAIGAGILLEETIRLTNARAKLIEQEALIAAVTNTPIDQVERQDLVARVGTGINTSGLSDTLANRNQASFQFGLNTLGISAAKNDPDLLLKIAKGFDAIGDPAKRATAAVQLFGADHAAEALDALNLKFIDASEAVNKYGTVLDAVSRRQIFQFRQDLLHLTEAFDTSAIKAFWDSIEAGAARTLAGAWSGIKAGASALDDFVARLTHLRGAIVDLQTIDIDPSKILRPNKDLDRVSDGLYQDSVTARGDKNQTLEGLRSRQSDAQSRADELQAQLDADHRKRQDSLDGKNGPDGNPLLDSERRFQLETAQRSAAALAASLADLIAIRESSEKIINQNRLTGAVDGNYATKRNAEVENQTADEVSRTGGNADDIRARLTKEYDARHQTAVAETLKGLREQIRLEETQAATQSFGSAATERATLDLKLHQIELDHDAESAKKLIKAEEELFAARKLNADQAKFNSAIQASADIGRVTQAIPQGSAAVHEAELQNRLDEMKRNGASSATLQAERDKDENQQNQHKIEDLETIIEKTEYLRRLTEAVPKGADAVTEVEHTHQQSELLRAGKGDLIRPTIDLNKAEADHAAAVQAKQEADDAAQANEEAKDNIAQINEAAKGEQKDLQIQGQKLAAERAYGLQLAHTSEQQIAYLNKIASLEKQAREEKIKGLQDEFEDANSYDDPKEEVKAAHLAADIAKLKAESNNADYEAQTKILGVINQQNDAYQARKELLQALTNWKQIDLGTYQKDFADAALQVPGSIGNSISSGIFDKQKGQSTGQAISKDLENGLKNLGKNLLGNLLTHAIENLIGQLIGQAALTALQTSSQAALIASNTALAAALAASTAAQTASGVAGAAGGAAGGAASAAGGAARAAGGAASSAATGLAGPLIAAAGGVIGGVISGVLSLIGDNKIVKAVNATTAAVYSLRGTNLNSTNGTGTTANGTSTSGTQTTSSSSGIPVIGGLLQSIFGFGGGSQPLPVSIESINPFAITSGIFKLFGFADGGNPPVNRPSIVGERGPELFMPNTAGRIYPNHMFSGSRSSTSSVHNYGGHTFHIHGATNPREVARQVADFLKSTSPKFSPASH